jgi:hypothetical protein
MNRRLSVQIPLLTFGSNVISDACALSAGRLNGRFFKQMSKYGSNIPKNQEHELKELWHTHGMEIVGPSLKI